MVWTPTPGVMVLLETEDAGPDVVDDSAACLVGTVTETTHGRKPLEVHVALWGPPRLAASPSVTVASFYEQDGYYRVTALAEHLDEINGNGVRVLLRLASDPVQLARRVPAHAPVAAAWLDGVAFATAAGETVDLSERGCRVRLAAALPEETTILLGWAPGAVVRGELLETRRHAGAWEYRFGLLPHDAETVRTLALHCATSG